MKVTYDDVKNLSTYEMKEIYDMDRAKGLEIILVRLENFINDIIWTRFPTYAQKNAGYEDLQSVGKITVCEKMPEYDPKYALTTYFQKFLIGDMYAFISKEHHRLSKNDRSKSATIQKAAKALSERGIKPTVANIVREIGRDSYSPEVVYVNLMVVNSASNQISLDTSVQDANGSLLDMLRSDHVTPETAVEEKEREEIIAEAIDSLDDLSAAVIRSLFFFENNVTATAAELGISESLVKKIRTKAFLTLYSSPILRDYLGKTGNEKDNFQLSFSEDDDVTDHSVEITIQWD